MRFNYNLFTGQMDMINSKGDTLEMQPMRELKLITVADHVFLHAYNTGYLEILYQSTISLGVRNLLVSSTSTIAGNSYIRSTNGEASKQNFTSQATYYFIDKDTKLYKATPSSIRKLFDDHQKTVKEYLNDNNVDFNKGADLIRLLTFCTQLTTQTQR
ncbi:MAG: hypothetical protein QM762_13380 [Chryseolinea sp.]